MLFIRNRVTDENVQVPTRDEPMPNQSPTGNGVDHESHMEFMASF